jgi:hypothetical protein
MADSGPTKSSKLYQLTSLSETAQPKLRTIITTTNTITQSDNILGPIIPILAQTLMLLDKISATAAAKKDLVMYGEEAKFQSGSLDEKLDKINEKLDMLTTRIEDSEERGGSALSKVEQRLKAIALELDMRSTDGTFMGELDTLEDWVVTTQKRLGCLVEQPSVIEGGN